jgi:hypothetical protein
MAGRRGPRKDEYWNGYLPDSLSLVASRSAPTMKILTILWRIIAGALAAVGVAIVPRTYSESPSRQLAASSRSPDDAHMDGPHADGAPAEREASSTAPATATSVSPVGWSRPKPEHIPHPTYWPFIFSAGVALVFWGLISNIFILSFGFILFVIGLAGWIWDMLTE